MKLLGIDYGRQRIGLAVGETFASPLKTLKVKQIKDGDNEAINEIGRICVANNVKKIILGLPLNREGKEGKAAREVKDFGQRLSTRLKVKIDYFDESLSSQNALQEMIKGGASRKARQKKLDAVAAALILQGYINSREERRKNLRRK